MKISEIYINNLAVELSVKIQDLLEPNEDYPPYEYYSEALQIAKVALADDYSDIDLTARLISKELSEALDFNYTSEQFEEIARFLTRRVKYIQKYSV